MAAEADFREDAHEDRPSPPRTRVNHHRAPLCSRPRGTSWQHLIGTTETTAGATCGLTGGTRQGPKAYRLPGAVT